MRRRDLEEALIKAAFAAGVTIEQLGAVDGIHIDVAEDGTISLGLGEQGEEAFDELDEAMARIEEYGEDVGGDGTKSGAIVVLVRKLNALVANLPKTTRLQALLDREDQVVAIADNLGLEHSYTMLGKDECEIELEDNEAGFFTDSNSTTWIVFVDGSVDYRLFGDAE